MQHNRQTTVKTATFIKDVSENFTGTAKLFKLDPPVAYPDYAEEPEGTTSYVVSSAATAMFSGPETYLFPADSEGNVLNWGELNGSFRGGLDCEGAIRNAGYEIAEAGS